MKSVKRWLARALESRQRDRRKRRALRAAMLTFSRLHPHWYHALFDEGLLKRLPVSSVADMDPTDLAREWTRQFKYSDERRRDHDVRRVTPVAACFLGLLQGVEGAASDCAASDARPSAGPPGALDGVLTVNTGPGDEYRRKEPDAAAR